jgi:DNA processing protein
MKVLSISGDQLPKCFQHLYVAPQTIYYRGDVSLLYKTETPKIAIVGARKIVPYGKQVTAEFANKLASHGCIVVSGLAYGVDGQAHRSCMDGGGKTIAVLPSDVSNVYPSQHRSLADDIVKNGGLVISEYADNPAPMRHNYIDRNRLIAALGDAVVVTQANNRSGALHTVRFGLEQGKTILSVPASIYEASFLGNNQLLKNGASPALDVYDILYSVGIVKKTNQSSDNTVINAANKTEYDILTSIKQGCVDEEELRFVTKLSAQEFTQALMEMELEGKITCFGPGKWLATG